VRAARLLDGNNNSDDDAVGTDDDSSDDDDAVAIVIKAFDCTEQTINNFGFTHKEFVDHGVAQLCAMKDFLLYCVLQWELDQFEQHKERVTLKAQVSFDVMSNHAHKAMELLRNLDFRMPVVLSIVAVNGMELPFDFDLVSDSEQERKKRVVDSLRKRGGVEAPATRCSAGARTRRVGENCRRRHQAAVSAVGGSGRRGGGGGAGGRRANAGWRRRKRAFAQVPRLREVAHSQVRRRLVPHELPELVQAESQEVIEIRKSKLKMCNLFPLGRRFLSQSLHEYWPQLKAGQ